MKKREPLSWDQIVKGTIVLALVCAAYTGFIAGILFAAIGIA